MNSRPIGVVSSMRGLSSRPRIVGAAGGLNQSLGANTTSRFATSAVIV
jgi:hypothetical protein